MEDDFGVNQISLNQVDPAKLEFKYDFINTPWDDRTTKSKIGIVALLIAIFLAIVACIVNNLVMHYHGFFDIMNKTEVDERHCFRVRNDEHNYVARIYSVISKDILCVGAVISTTSILANGICAKLGPMRIHLGSNTDPQCKKGMAVDSFQTLFHEGVVSKELLLLKYEDTHNCGSVLKITTNTNLASKVFIIGRSEEDHNKYLSQYYVSLETAKKPPSGIHHMKMKNMFCVSHTTLCPARVGDLLVQNNALLGLVASSVYSNGLNYVCFADLKMVRRQLLALDPKIFFL